MPSSAARKGSRTVRVFCGAVLLGNRPVRPVLGARSDTESLHIVVYLLDHGAEKACSVEVPRVQASSAHVPLLSSGS